MAHSLSVPQELERGGADIERVTPEPGWYPDPFDPSRDRWWNGSAWTENTQAGPQTPDPYAGARVDPPPAGGDYVSELDDNGTPLPDYEVLASVEEGAKFGQADQPTAPPAVEAGGWGEDGNADTGKGKKRKIGKILGLVGVVLALLLVSGTAAAFFLFNGRGPQVEDILPANTAFMARVDFDPSLEQKTNVLRLISRFPQLEPATSGENANPQTALIDALIDQDSGENQAALTDAKKWIGARIGIALIPADNQEFSAVVVASFTDEEALNSFMEKYASEYFYATTEGYVVISDSKDSVADVLAAEQHLSSSTDFQNSRERLELDAIALAWSDASQVRALQQSLSEGSLPETPLTPSISDSTVEAAGYSMLGVAAEPDAIRLALVTESLVISETPSINLGVSGDGLSNLPDEVLGAISLAAPGQIVEDILSFIDSEQPELSAEIDEAFAAIGIERENVSGFLGEQITAFALPGLSEESPLLVLSINEQDITEKKLNTILKNLSGATDGVSDSIDTASIEVYQKDGTTYILPMGGLEQLETVLDGSGSLGDSENFRRVFPSGSAGLISGFVGEGAFSRIGGASADESFWGGVLSLGLKVTVDPEQSGDSRTEVVLSFR